MGMEPVLLRNYASDVNSPAEFEKRYYSVADVCAMLGITRKTLFFYDREDLLKPRKRKGPQNAKLYLSEDIVRLKTILEYKKAGLLLKEIRILLDDDSCSPKEILENALARAEKEKKEKEEIIRCLRQRIAALSD
jgi:DNA-binding transcriptional MerR regulator